MPGTIEFSSELRACMNALATFTPEAGPAAAEPGTAAAGAGRAPGAGTATGAGAGAGTGTGSSTSMGAASAAPLPKPIAPIAARATATPVTRANGPRTRGEPVRFTDNGSLLNSTDAPAGALDTQTTQVTLLLNSHS